MALADQLKALLRSHSEGDDAQFYSIAMQLAAHEAKVGHGKLAKELREQIDQAKNGPIGQKKPVLIARPRGELSELLSAQYPKQNLEDIVLSEEIRKRLDRLIKEHKEIRNLRAHGLSPRKRVLLVGPPGTGKTLTASVIAGELGLPLFTVRLDSLITKFMGETASKLRIIFDAITQTRGVYLFDEFDSIGSQRGLSNDVGEIRRVLNSFLQMVEQDTSDSLLVAATNHAEILDHALFRRFDDIIEYELPNRANIQKVLKSKLANTEHSQIDWEKLSRLSEGLSYAGITTACEDAIKHMIINKEKEVTTAELSISLKDRLRIRKG
jgi:SpoVK/Ycf46/Vps4 family AAA+-type ATPase